MKPVLLNILSLIFIFLACNKSSVYVHEFENNQWDHESDVGYNFEINNTNQNYDINLFFRNNLSYPYRNIYLLVELKKDDETIKKDTLQYAITNKYGQWYGKGVGDLKNNFFSYQRALRFTSTGGYSLNIKHGMRQNPLMGCENFGVKINKNNE